MPCAMGDSSFGLALDWAAGNLGGMSGVIIHIGASGFPPLNCYDRPRTLPAGPMLRDPYAADARAQGRRPSSPQARGSCIGKLSTNTGTEKRFMSSAPAELVLSGFERSGRLYPQHHPLSTQSPASTGTSHSGMGDRTSLVDFVVWAGGGLLRKSRFGGSNFPRGLSAVLGPIGARQLAWPSPQRAFQRSASAESF